MTPPRTQQHRHWVQIEYTPIKGSRRALHLDLNMVDEVMVIIGNNPDDFGDRDFAKGVRITYAGTLKPIDLANWQEYKNPAANNFYKIWKEFIELKADTPPATLGLIQVASENMFKT